MMSEDTGVLRTAKHFKNENDFPLTFLVEARDSDAQEQGSHRTRARIVVNKLADINRMALSFPNAAPSDLRNYYTELEELLDKKTGLVSGIERMSSQKYLAKERIGDRESGCNGYMVLSHRSQDRAAGEP